MKVRASSPPYSSLGVRKSGPSKHKPKRFLRRLVNYLKSDSYMFAPNISSSLKRKYVLSPRIGFHVNAAGLEIGGEGDGKEKKKRLVDMIGEYMRSDSYMYSPLIEGESSGVARKEIVDPSSEGALCLTKKVTTSTARTAVLTRESNFQPTKESRGVIGEGQTEPFFIASHESDNASELPKQGETLKQVVFPNCWSTLLPEGDIAGNNSMRSEWFIEGKSPSSNT